MRASYRVGAAALALAFLTASPPAAAIPGTYVFVDDGRCDPHTITLTHELGEAPAFPLDELISATGLTLELPFTCTTAGPPGDPPVPNDKIITITNLSPFAWVDLFFVADDGIFIGNADGTIKGGDAFKIDTVGINTPLLSESGTVDLIFSPGESWTFIVQDQLPPDIPTDLMGSIGVGVESDDTTGTSWASIVAIRRLDRVEEPGTLALIVLAMLAFGAVRCATRSGRYHVKTDP